MKGEAASFQFAVGQRAFATLGSNVRLPSNAALAFLCNVGLENDSTAARLGHLVYGQRVLENVPINFSVSRLKGKRSFVFARAGYGKSNLIKYLISQLYSSPPDVGLLIFDPEGEYALPTHGRPGLVNVPALRERLCLYTNRQIPPEYSFVHKGAVALDLGELPPQDLVAAFVPADKQDTVFANLLRSLDLRRRQDAESWKKLIQLLAEHGFGANDEKIAQLLSYKARKDDVSLRAIKNNLVPVIRRLHACGAKLGSNILEELREHRIVVVDTSTLGSEDGLAVSELLLRRIFFNNLRHFTDLSIPPLRCLAVLEEAQTVLGERTLDDRNIFVRWVKEGRKYELGAILVTQQPGAISPQIISQGDNFFVLHLLNETDLQTLKRHNSYYSDEILSFLRAEPIKGNCYFWSAPDQPFVLPARVCNFDEVARDVPVPTRLQPVGLPRSTEPAPRTTARQLSELTALAIQEALFAHPRVWLYPVSKFGGKKENGCVAFSCDYLQHIVAQRLSENSAFRAMADGARWLQNKLPLEIETVLKRHKVRSGYAVLAGAARRVWVVPQAELKLARQKTLRPDAVEVTDKL